MAQIVTVSPATAAYAAQAYKATTRPTTLFEQKIEAWADAARIGDNFQLRGILTVVKPPALALVLLTMERQNDTTFAAAARSYAEIGAEGDLIAAPEGMPTRED
ncbi:hypothetical protein OCK02_14740 [Rhizobium sp. TRM96647]|uniref:hypothetical protein n=1 Tax=unclassified Rhizobium TaxID=2613769 RepID=UPI0021E82FF4|nr:MULTISPECIES: hypothetical protein [unclassified Rhizobium]MCV3737471.1 hypothetical protein [Rhizobium sp. TRM96647]MCV3756439.1 hypothetical protein [Rhizobium sp. TRM96650]